MLSLHLHALDEHDANEHALAASQIMSTKERYQ
jgi:hypothetical protein